MNIKIYGDCLNRSYSQHLIEAVKVANNAQNFFFLSKEIEEITLSNKNYVDPKKAEELLVNQEQKNAKKICVTSKPFSDNWFSHEYREVSIISVSDWEDEFAPPALRCYLIYEIAQALLAFISDLSEDMALKIVHEPPAGCLMDFCGYKPNIKLGMISGNLCLKCKGALLELGTVPDGLDAIERILKHVRSEAIGKRILTDHDSAFIMMRFTENDENDNAYKYGIKLGLEEVGVNVIRGDNRVSSEQILDKIINLIDKCRFVVAKVDEDNLNVYFELGFAMGSEKDVLLISEKEKILTLPSDLKNWECLTYSKGNYGALKEGIIRFFEDKYRLPRRQNG